jgi:serine-aspartate repeat-containing protein C/D/E
MRTKFSLRGRAHVLDWVGPFVGALAVVAGYCTAPAVADEPANSPDLAAKTPADPSSSARLSVLNGGEAGGESKPATASDNQAPFARTDLNDGAWLFLVDEDDADDDEDEIVAESFRLGHLSDRARPLAGDFDGDGDAEFVLFVDGEWFVDYNGNGRWDEGDLYVRLGDQDDQPVVGDWDGDGKDDVGVFGPNKSAGDQGQATAGLPDAENKQAIETKDTANNTATAGKSAVPNRQLQKTSTGDVQNGEVDYVLIFDGRQGTPLAGDFNGDGVDTLAVFDNGRWFIDVDGDGRLSDVDFTAEFGKTGDLPFIADFDGDEIDEIGVFRDGVWFVDSNNNRQLDDQDQTFKLGAAGDRPAPADLFGNGKDVAATYRPRATDETSAASLPREIDAPKLNAEPQSTTEKQAD